MYTDDRCWECEQRKPQSTPLPCAYPRHYKGVCKELTTERVYHWDRWIPACREHGNLLRRQSPSERNKPPKKRLADF